MAKKLLCVIVLALSLVCALASCGGNEDSSGNSAHTHNYGEWETTKSATCTEEGVQERSCACGEKETQVLSIVDHVEGEWIIEREPTKAEDGAIYTECTMCKKIMSKEILLATGSVGLAYELNSDNTCTITGIGVCTDSHVVIPSSINGYMVTAIANRAFYECATMTEITIPESVNDIGIQVFKNAKNLHTVYYNSSYSSYSVPHIVYPQNDNPILNLPHITTVIFNGTTVPSCILNGSTNVKEVIIGDNVKSIEAYAFKDCKSMSTIKISDNVTSVGAWAFDCCSSLTDVYYDGDINGWLQICFSNYASTPMHSAKNLYFNNELVSNITIPSNINAIPNYSFLSCDSLTAVIIPGSVLTIGESAFSNCDSLVNISIPDSVTTIGTSAFSGCSSLTSIEIPDSVKNFGGSLFSYCSSLVNISLGTNITKLLSNHSFEPNVGMFEGCTSLTCIVIPYTVVEIESAFRDCTSLTSIIYDGTVEEWNAIRKSVYWNKNTGNYTIYCTDGNIEK